MWWTLRNLDLYLFAGWLRRRCVRRNYDILIPIECFSLIAVDASGQMERDVIYYNMELLDWSAENPLYVDKPVLKALESRALLGVRHVMITSPERGKIFAGINSFPPARISALPVAPLRRPPRARSRYFRERFAIPDDRLILVYSGNFAPWAKCVEIIDGMGNWPANAVLVMHTWNGAAMSSAYFAQMREAAASKAVHFSSEFLLYDDLAPALSSAEIGLMFYEAIDANLTEILFSSNKMAEYMAAGLPIICSPFPSLADFVHGERIGFTAGLDGIGPAASRIAADLETYRASVAECRRRHFEFERYFHEAFTAYADAPAR
jgi:glycosyltransferase involved in cell wall biosynthesis